MMSAQMVDMTNALSSIALPHWLMFAGGLLVVLGCVGCLMRPVEDPIAGEPIFMLEGGQAQAEDTIALKPWRGAISGPKESLG
jgi:hypothetical protein